MRVSEEAKTNVMAFNGIDPVRIDETEIELVPMLKYLASKISMKHTTVGEIKIKKATARIITSKIINIWKDDDISVSLKERLVCSLGWSVPQHGWQ